ncbi:MAG: secretion system protein, partial [Halobacteriota archaeon]
VYQWQAETDEYLQMGQSNTLDGIAFDRGWRRDRLESELLAREIVLAYLIHEGLNTYTQVAATLQAFLNDPETILTLIANDDLERSLEDLREMESVEIDIDPDKEAMVPRPDASDEMLEETEKVLEKADPVLEEYRGTETGIDITEALDLGAVDDLEVMGGASGGSAESGVGAAVGNDTDVDDEDAFEFRSAIDLESDAASDPEPDLPNLDDLRPDGDDEQDP